MAFVNDAVRDTAGLGYATTNGTKIDICSTEPATFEAIAGVTLGNDTVVTGAVEDGAGADGRRVIVPAITAGTVSGTGTAAFWALSDGTSILVATGPLSATQGVTSGNTFTLDAIDITLPDSVAV